MCCSGFLKVMMFIFNGSVFLAGAAIFGTGVWVRVDSDTLLDLLDTEESELSQLVNVSYVLIAVGAVLVVIGFLGCCGAVRESRCMLLTFFSIMLIIFLIELGGAVVLFVFEGSVDKIFQDLEDTMKTKIKDEYGDNESTLTSLWDTTMEQFKCCGIKNYTDFDGSPFNDVRGTYPPTCCSTSSIECNESDASSAMIAGCLDKLVQIIEDNTVIIAAVVVGIIGLEIAAMVVSMVLYCRIGNKA